MEVRHTWTDRDEAGDYGVPNVLSPRDLVSRPENGRNCTTHTQSKNSYFARFDFGIVPAQSRNPDKVIIFYHPCAK